MDWIMQYFPCARIHHIDIAMAESKKSMTLKQDTYLKKSGPTLVYDRGIRKGFKMDIARNGALNADL